MRQVKEVIEGRSVISTPPDAAVLDVVRTMTEKNIGAVPVIDNARLIGIFTERDLMTRVVSRELAPAETKISDVMSRDVGSAGPDDVLADCIDKMQSSGYRHLPVVSDGKVIGVISLRDLLQVDRKQIRHENDLLNELVTEEPYYDV